MSDSKQDMSQRQKQSKQPEAFFFSEEDFEQVSEKVRGKIALVDSKLHVSDDLKGSVDLTNIVARLRRRGINEYEFHTPKEFDDQYAKHTYRFARGDNAIQRLAIDLIARAYKTGATDIHIVDAGTYVRVKFRVLGMLCEDTQMEAETGRLMIGAICDVLGKAADGTGFSNLERQDGCVSKRDYLPSGVQSVRIHTEPIECTYAQYGTGTLMALRLLYDATKAKGTLAERLTALGFSEQHCQDMHDLTLRTGLKIISGPTGHGKTTVLKHTMEAQTETNPEKSYLSVEDPPEFDMRDVNQIKVITKDQGNFDRTYRAQAYLNAIAGAMRSDSDVLMIGEIRYPEAAVAAIDAGLTGQSVWATVHANNGFGIITRLESLLRSAGYEDPLDSLCDPNVLAGLEYQRLLPKLCPECKKSWKKIPESERSSYIPPDIYDRLTRVIDPDIVEGLNGFDGIFVQNHIGCPNCFHGLKDQTVAAEVIVMDTDILGLLRKGDIPEAHRLWRSKGGKTYIEHAMQHVQNGLVDPVCGEARLGVPWTFNKFFEEAGMTRS